MVAAAYPDAPAALAHRARQDEEQKSCSSRSSESFSAAEARRIVESARASIRYPADGRLIGDWKHGEQLVRDAAGERIRDNRVEKVKENGALCVNCHALDPNDVNVGNLGPSLTHYALQRSASEALIKYTYEKIYNSWAYYPCSHMPRFGRNGFLTPEQIADVVAYLIDLRSPVNRSR